MKKLVRIDSGSDRFLDIDTIKLNRQAVILRDYILKNIEPASDPFGVLNGVLPLCDKAIKGEFKESVEMESLPLRYQVGEGLLPNAFSKLFADFCITLSGTSLEEYEVIDRNGQPYAYVEFE